MKTPPKGQHDCTAMPSAVGVAQVENEDMSQKAKSDLSEDENYKQTRKSLKSRKRVAKACDNCAHRKVKCDGNMPCMPCLLRGRTCQAKKVDRRKHLTTLFKDPEQVWTHSLKEIYGEKILQPLVEPLTPSTDLSSHHDETSSLAGSPLDLHGTDLKRVELDKYLDSFCQNTHSRYPFLHVPTLRSRYAAVPEISLLSPTSIHPRNMEHRAQISQIYVCLAIGDFSRSFSGSRSRGSYPSGWGLYSAAVQMHGDFLLPRLEFQDQLLVPQTMLLMAIYLAFVDSLDLAKRLLSVAILQLRSTENRLIDRQKIPIFHDELSRRAKFYCYVLERELGIGHNLPFMISDTNLDDNLPRMVSDSWLESRREDTRNFSELWRDVEEDRAANTISASYTLATEIHVKAISLISRTIHQKSLKNVNDAPKIIETLERVVDEAERKAGLVQQRQYRNGPATRDRKEEALMQIKWCYLRLLICENVLRQPQSLNVSNTLCKDRTNMTCLLLVKKILETFLDLPNEYPKLFFPFVDYLVHEIDLGMELIADDTLLQQCYGRIIYQNVEYFQEIAHCTSSIPVRITRRILSMGLMMQRLRSGRLENCNSNSGQPANHIDDPSYTQKTPPGIAIPASGEERLSPHEHILSVDNSSSTGGLPIQVPQENAGQEINNNSSYLGAHDFPKNVKYNNHESHDNKFSTPPPFIGESGSLDFLGYDPFQIEMHPDIFDLVNHDNASLLQGS